MSITMQLPPDVTSVVAMIVVDSRIESLKADVVRLKSLESPLALAAVGALEGLTAALKAYVAEQQRAVKVATEMPRLVAP